MEFALGLQQPDGTFHGDPGSMTLDGAMMTRPFAQRCWFCRKRALRRLRRTTASCSFVYEDDSWVQGSFRSLALQSSWACWSPTPDHGATARPSLHLISPSRVRVHSNARCLSSRAACERLLKTQEQKLNDAQHVLSAWGGNSHQLPNVVAAVAECATQFPVSAPQHTVAIACAVLAVLNCSQAIDGGVCRG